MNEDFLSSTIELARIIAYVVFFSRDIQRKTIETKTNDDVILI